MKKKLKANEIWNQIFSRSGIIDLSPLGREAFTFAVEVMRSEDGIEVKELRNQRVLVTVSRDRDEKKKSSN